MNEPAENRARVVGAVARLAKQLGHADQEDAFVDAFLDARDLIYLVSREHGGAVSEMLHARCAHDPAAARAGDFAVGFLAGYVLGRLARAL